MDHLRLIARLIPVFSAAFVLLGATGTANAADGPRVITHCTVIDRPGFHVLVKNIVARASDVNGTLPNAGCILITADFVTLDLGGFVISSDGNPASGIAADSNDHQGITVRNGSVVGFGLNGVFLQGSSHIVENVRATGNAFIGFVVGLGSNNSIVRNNVAVANGTGGFNAAGSIIGNVATDNPQVGILALCPSLIMQNIAARNGTEFFGAQIVGLERGLQPCTQLENNPLP